MFSLYFRYYTQTFFVTRLIINKINKVQWVDFKLENVLVSLHSLKTMGLGFIIFKEWRVTWTFSYTYRLQPIKPIGKSGTTIRQPYSSQVDALYHLWQFEPW